MDVIAHRDINAFNHSGSEIAGLVVAGQSYNLQAGETTKIRGKTTGTGNFFPEDILVDNAPASNNVKKVHSSVYRRNDKGKVQVYISNATTEICNINQGDILAVFDSLVQGSVDSHRPESKRVDIKIDTIAEPNPPKELPKGARELKEEMNLGDMTEREHHQLFKIIVETLHAFARTTKDVGCFNGFKKPYKIKLKSNAEVQWQKQFVMPIIKQKYVSQWIEKMIIGGIIQRCPEGKWQSPIFVVPKKKPNEYRLVNDFRKMNEQIEHEFFPRRK